MTKFIISGIGICLLTFIPANAMAQMDTLAVDGMDGAQIVRIVDEQYDWIDTCVVDKYGIACKNDKYGIYDLAKKQEITRIDCDSLSFSGRNANEDGSEVFSFYAEKGLQYGNIIVSDGEFLTVWMDDPKYFAKLNDCTSIDNAITEKCREKLAKAMKEIDGKYGQLAVMDAHTGQLKAWVAVEKTESRYIDGKLLKHSCTSHLAMPMLIAGLLGKTEISLDDSVDVASGILNVGDSLVVRDHNWRSGGYGKITYRQGFLLKSNVAMFKALCRADKRKGKEKWIDLNSAKKDCDALNLAAVVGGIYNNEGKMLTPTLYGDNVVVSDDIPFTPKMLSNMRSVLVEINTSGGIQAKYAPKNIPIAGLYDSVKVKDEREQSFAGCFPADNPRYFLGAFIDKNGEDPVSPCQLSTLVNDIIEWLSKI